MRSIDVSVRRAVRSDTGPGTTGKNGQIEELSRITDY